MLPKLITLPMASAMRERFVAAAGLADRGADEEGQKQHEERDHGELAQGQQPGDADGGNPRQLQMIADEQCDRDVRPLIERMDRRHHDSKGDDGPRRNEIGGEQRAVE